jgi:phospholipid-translocating ATPase
MSFLRRGNGHHSDTSDTEDELDERVDPELRLRTVRTAHSAIAESIRSEQRMERRKTRRRRRFFQLKKKPSQASVTKGASGLGDAPAPSTEVPGQRRNVYVNHPLSAMEVDSKGEPVARYERNKVRTTSALFTKFTGNNLLTYFRIHFPYVHSEESVRTIPAVSPTIYL